MKRGVSFLFSALVVFLLQAPARGSLAQPPTLPDVLSRAAEYVAAFSDPSRLVLCEERYQHTYSRLIVNMSGSAERVPQGGHAWVAELAVVATPVDEPNGLPWIEFRDIIELDGKPQRDGTSRLTGLFTQPMAVAGPEALKITLETRRTQFGRLDRAVLLPRLTFVFLHAVNQPRFVFKKGGERTIKGVRTWEIKYQEKATPTIVATTAGRDAPSSGAFWIDPATGHILSSVLKNGDSSALYHELTVTYALDPATGLCLPASLKDKTFDSEDGKELEGKGTFQNWRVVPRPAR